MKRNLFKSSLMILGLLFFQPAQALEGIKQPTDVETRSKVYEKHLRGNVKGELLFTSMKVWHEEDYNALLHVVKQPTNRERLGRIHELLNQSFETNTINHSKVALAYAVYSMVISLDSETELKDRIEAPLLDSHYDCAFYNLRRYLEKTSSSGYHPPFFISSKERFNSGHLSSLQSIIEGHALGLKWLPFVSETGFASFETQNRQSGMNAPVLGVPLRRITYSAETNQQPDDYYGPMNYRPFERCIRDIHNGFGTSQENLEVTGYVYRLFWQAESTVRAIQDSQTRAVCEFFLNLMGNAHFGIVTSYVRDDSTNHEWAFRFPQPTLEEACDGVVEATIKRIRNIVQSFPPDHMWKKVSDTLLEGYSAGQGYGMSTAAIHDTYYEETSKVGTFVNLANGKLFSVESMINITGSNKQRAFDNFELIEAFRPGFLKTLRPGKDPFRKNNTERTANYEIDLLYGDVWGAPLGTEFYNQLIAYKRFLNQHGFPFELWEGDKFQVDVVVGVFQKIHEMFKKEILKK